MSGADTSPAHARWSWPRCGQQRRAERRNCVQKPGPAPSFLPPALRGRGCRSAAASTLPMVTCADPATNPHHGVHNFGPPVASICDAVRRAFSVTNGGTKALRCLKVPGSARGSPCRGSTRSSMTNPLRQSPPINSCQRCRNSIVPASRCWLPSITGGNGPVR